MNPEKRQQLEAMVNESPTLKEERKEIILKALDYLSDEQADKLIKVFTDARKKREEIEQKYSGAALELKKQYLEKANEFTQQEITEAFHEWEKAENKKEEVEIEEIEKQIDKLPE